METAAVQQMQQTVQNSQPVAQQNPPTNPTNPTNEQNVGDQSIFDKLEKKYQVAIFLRLQGCSHYQIADEISKTYNHVFEDTVAHWFAKGGQCYEIYTKMKQDALATLDADLREAKEQIKQGAVEAAGIVRRHIRGEKIDPDILVSARDLLDRAGFPKVTKQQMEGQIESTGLTETAKALKAIASSLRQPPVKSVKPQPVSTVKPVTPPVPLQQPQGGQNGQS